MSDERPAVGLVGAFVEAVKSSSPLEILGVILGLVGTLVGVLALGWQLGQSFAERRIYDLESENQVLLSQQMKAPERNEVPVSGCPDESDVSGAVGVAVKAFPDEEHNWDVCRFRWWNDEIDQTTEVVCPTNYICTFELAGGERVHVVSGDGVRQERAVEHGIWRFQPAYPESAVSRDPCYLLLHEQDWYSTGPSALEPYKPEPHIVVPENFTC